MNTQPDMNTSALMFAAGQGYESESTTGFAAGSRMYANMPAAQYHSDKEALSCSMLKPLLESPAHFQANLLSLNKATKAMDFGSLVHGLVLEPHLIGNDFSIYPGIADGRSSDYKAFLAKNSSRLVVDEPTFTRARKLAEKILHRVVFGRPLWRLRKRRHTRGKHLRRRAHYRLAAAHSTLDLYHPEYSFDLKTTRHGLISAFVRDAVDMHYDFQAFMYTIARSLYEGRTNPAKFVFIAAETEEPNSIHQITAGETFMSNGAKKFQEVLSVYSACMQTGFWPDSSGNAEAEIEPWQSFTGKSDWKAAFGWLPPVLCPLNHLALMSFGLVHFSTRSMSLSRLYDLRNSFSTSFSSAFLMFRRKLLKVSFERHSSCIFSKEFGVGSRWVV